jgi:hypothetical protein
MAGKSPDPFAEQLKEARAGIEAAGRIEPYNDEVLRTAYLGASALIDGAELKPVEQITYRREIAELAGKLATDHEDETTAAEMDARVNDCDSILKLIQTQEESTGTKPGAKKTPPKRGRPPKRASTGAGKTSGAKGS